jgi:hypothetical protein
MRRMKIFLSFTAAILFVFMAGSIVGNWPSKERQNLMRQAENIEKICADDLADVWKTRGEHNLISAGCAQAKAEVTDKLASTR